MEKIHPNNRRRLMRSLTILERSGKRQSDMVAEQAHEMIYDAFIVGCTMERSVLYERINSRVHRMIEDGLEQEVSGLLCSGVTFSSPPMKGIGYKEWEAYFNGTATLQETEELIAKHSRQYSKKQYTLFRHQMPVHWFDVTSEEEHRNILEEIGKWLER